MVPGRKFDGAPFRSRKRKMLSAAVEFCAASGAESEKQVCRCEIAGKNFSMYFCSERQRTEQSKMFLLNRLRAKAGRISGASYDCAMRLSGYAPQDMDDFRKSCPHFAFSS